jgi:hypothetical protein
VAPLVTVGARLAGTLATPGFSQAGPGVSSFDRDERGETAREGRADWNRRGSDRDRQQDVHDARCNGQWNRVVAIGVVIVRGVITEEKPASGEGAGAQ